MLQNVIFLGWIGLGLVFVAATGIQGEYAAAAVLAVIFAYPIALVAYVRDTGGPVGEDKQQTPSRIARRVGQAVRFTWFYVVGVLVISALFTSFKLSLFFLAIGFAPFALPKLMRRWEARGATEAAIKAAGESTGEAPREIAFKPVYRFKEVGGSNLLLVDPKSRQFAVRRGWKLRYYPYSDLIAVEVEKDGFNVKNTKKESSLMAGVAGGLIAGPVGMALGLFSGGGSTTTSREVVHELALKLHINDAASPVYRLKFLKSRTGCSVKQAQRAAKSLDEWYARMRGTLQPHP